MYPKFKICKREKPDDTSYTLLNSTTVKRAEWPDRMSYYNVMSLDPATKNFAIRVERRWANGKVETVMFDKYNFVLDDPVMTNLSYERGLDHFKKLFNIAKDCHYILSERQLPQNYKAVRMSQHVLSTLMMATMDCSVKPVIIEVNSQLKGRQLGAPRGCRDKELKKWSVEIGTELLIFRDDQYALSILKKTKKKDDLCDTVLQAEALFQLLGDLIGVRELDIKEVKREGLPKIRIIH